MNYKVSIIIPIYNVEAYFKDCLVSVVRQNITEGVECILIDDCGKDNSIKIAEQILKEYNGEISFSVIHHERNKGLSAARNTGIKAAKGEYLYFLDSDDKISDDCISSMWSLVEKYGKVDLVQGSYFVVGKEEPISKLWKHGEFSNNKKDIKHFLLNYHGKVTAAQNRLIRREFILENNLFFKDGIIHEDNYWTFFLAKHVNHMAVNKNKTYFHIYNPDSIMNKINIEKESHAYRTIIKDFCSDIDPFLPGRQKELILYNLLTALERKAYRSEKEREELVKTFLGKNSLIEKILLRLYLNNKNNKILHLLIRLYGLSDKSFN